MSWRVELHKQVCVCAAEWKHSRGSPIIRIIPYILCVLKTLNSLALWARFDLIQAPSQVFDLSVIPYN